MPSAEAFEVVGNELLAAGVHRLEVEAPRIARIRRPGQFVIVHTDVGSERIPLTIADADEDRGTITLVVQSVGRSTAELVALPPGAAIRDVVGPLGRPTEIVPGGRAVCVGGGVGTAVVLPVAQALHRLGTALTVVVGARTAALVLLEDELRRYGEVVVTTEDGTRGRPGLVTGPLAELVAASPPDVVYAAGPVAMMRAVSELTRPAGVRTIVSLNPIMVDGTGMCGGCRVTVGGRMLFACVEGPEFDGHQVDFEELADRLTTYRRHEREAVARGATPS